MSESSFVPVRAIWYCKQCRTETVQVVGDDAPIRCFGNHGGEGFQNERGVNEQVSDSESV